MTGDPYADGNHGMETSMVDVLTQDTLLMSILMCMTALGGLIGNALMLRALIKYKSLRIDFYTVLGSLSIADSLFLVLSVPTQIMDMISTPYNTVTFCKANHYLMTVSGFIAAYLIVVLSVLRGILLTNRNTIRQPRALHLIIVSAVFYVLAFLTSIPVIALYSSDGYLCYFVDPFRVSAQRKGTWLLSAFSVFVPLGLVALIYFMTYMVGKRYFSDSYSPREKEKSRLVSVIIIAFIICQLPYRIASIYVTYLENLDFAQYEKYYQIKSYLYCLLLTDKAIRPILCSKLATDLSEAFDEVINCTHCARPYSMAPLYDRTHERVLNTGSTTPTTNTTYVSSSESQGNSTDRPESTSSANSATSQTPLTQKDDEVIEIMDLGPKIS